ncbi:MAG: acetyl-CoA C-acetyltransferase [Deltaproteobacteria bacterium]|nr:MAG: acetyl-CoA C-acetyltransferase [Deltaproteobacteria bacterium]
MKSVVIVSAVRTAIGDFGGALKDFLAGQLGAVVVREAVKRANVDPNEVDEVIMGNVFQAGQKANPARQASLGAGLPVEVPALTVNNQCASGIRAISAGADRIMAGEAEVIVAGGCESMTNVPYLLTKARFGYRLGNGEIHDSLYYDGLVDCFYNYHMGVTAENLAEMYDISREDQDRLAYDSHQRAVKAIREGKFDEEIVPVEVPQKKGEPILFKTDEHPREDTTLERLAKLKPVFKENGTVTAGNASGINDGAAAVVIMSEEKAKALGVSPMARIVSYAIAGVDPKIMGWGPVPATEKALKKADLSLSDIGLVELNEAFAAQALAVIRGLGLDWEITNVNGSGISLGHPVGATGCRMVVSLIHEMFRRKVRYGLATLCQGGGMGTALIIENLRI